MLSKQYEDLYVDDKSAINRDVIELDTFIQSRGWTLVNDSIDKLIDEYRDELENIDSERLREVQYALQNLKELKNIPSRLVQHIKSFEIEPESPPSDTGFDFINK